MASKPVLVLVASLLIGCGGTDGGSATAGSGGSSGSGGDGIAGSGGVASSETFSIKWGPTEVQPGTESTDCVVRRLGNDAPVFINQIQNVLGATSHHFIVYQVEDEEEQLEPFPCFPFQGSGTTANLLMITQKADDLLRFPEGVAYELEPNQMIRLELHYVNVTAAPQMAEATSTFMTVAEESVEFRAGIEFLGRTGFPTIPRNSMSTFQSFVSVDPSLRDANFFAITGHQHKLGINVVVNLVDQSNNFVESVYDVVDFAWDEPETVRHDPPFRIPGGGQFDLTCDWNNTTNQSVNFGTSVDDEMCFFWAYYYQ